MSSPDLGALLSRSRLVERWFHVGHTTDMALDDKGVSVRHVPHLGGRPQLPETLFVCAAYHVLTAAVTGRAAKVHLVDGSGTALPVNTAWAGDPPEIQGWRLEWSAGALARPLSGQAERCPVDTVRQWVALAPARPWRLTGAAAHLRVAPRSLQRSFARAGTSFQAEVLAVRLEIAGQLIRRTRLPLAEIAATAGFTDHPHLTRRFRERFGCTPAQFRGQPGLAGCRVSSSPSKPAVHS